MKKKYIRPASETVMLTSEALMLKTASITLKPGENTPDNFSNKQGWDSENWSSVSEDTEE